jgi:hypothetical protein
VFTEFFLPFLDEGFGAAFTRASAPFLAPDQFVNRDPQAIRATDPAYNNLKIGSSFTPPRQFVVERIPPEMTVLAPSLKLSQGGMVRLAAMTLDAPFDSPVNVTAEVQFPDGGSTSIPLSKRRLGSEGAGEIHEGSVEVILPGQTLFTYVGQDENGNRTALHSSVLIPSDGDLLVGPSLLLGSQENSHDPDVEYRFAPDDQRLFGIAERWYERLEP